MRLRRSTNGLILRLLPILALFTYAAPAPAVVLYATDQRNTNPPGTITNHGTGHTPGGPNDPRRLLNSGWQWVGNYSIFTGTAISPNHFVIASHVGINPNNTFFYQGQNYTIDTTFNGGTGFAQSPTTDLTVFRINGTFPNFAPMWNAAVDGSEVGKPLVAIGRGAKRGAEVRVNGVLKGWQFDFNGQDGLRSWGENVVSGIVNGGGGLGELVAMDFDAGGLWVGSNPQFIPDSDTDIPASSYATRISANLAWINSAIGAGVAPEPSVGLAVLALFPMLRRRPK